MPVNPVTFRRLGLVVVLGIGLATPVPAQKKDDKKLKEAERQEAQILVRAVDHAMSAQAPAGASVLTVDPSKKENGVTAAEGAPAMTFRHDTLKAQEGRIYVPFTYEFPADTVSQNVALYVRIAPQGATAASAAKGDKDEDKDEKEKRDGMFPFEDLHFTQATPVQEGRVRITRAFAVPAGNYDAYLAMVPHSQEKDKKNAPVRVVLFKQPVEVPDYWGGELNTSSIIVADKVEGLSAPLSPEQQRERPYVLGQTEIVPAVDSTFKKSEELTIIFQIYNPVFDQKKPDLLVEYLFSRVEGETEKPFNKMAPQQFNAQTLPPQFDPDAGFQIAAGWSVPLQSFPEGDYKLQIKVQDNKSQKTITRDVRFTVAGS